MVSLPKEWITRNRITKGSMISMDEGSSGNLVLSPLKDEREMISTSISYNGQEKARLLSEITGAYLLGFDLIRIEGDERVSYETRSAIKKAIGHLVGLEIVEEDAYSITTQFLLESSNLAPEKIFKRMHSIISGMNTDAISTLVDGDRRILKVITERDDEVDRLYFLLVRTIRSIVIDPMLGARYSIGPVECLDFRVAANVLESVGDTAVMISESITSLPSLRLSEESRPLLLSVSRSLDNMLDLAIRAFLSKDVNGARSTVDIFTSVSEEISLVRKVMTLEMPDKITSLLPIFDAMGRMAKASVDIADLAVPLYPVIR